VEGGEWLLLNLNEDPFEQNNLAFHTAYRQKRDEMLTLLQKWARQTRDEFPFPSHE
jgi:hypothetical protein